MNFLVINYKVNFSNKSLNFQNFKNFCKIAAYEQYRIPISKDLIYRVHAPLLWFEDAEVQEIYYNEIVN